MLRKYIAIIGAGPAGLCTARYCLARTTLAAQECDFFIEVFEQNDQLGGTWVYQPAENNRHSSMYKTLLTNRARETMAFTDFLFKNSSSLEGSSFITREEVLEYLHDYAEPIKQSIRYNHTVTNVKRSLDDDRWALTFEKTLPGGQLETQTKNFDCVFVCNGHFTVPKMPSFADKYRKPAIHCHYYDQPEDYLGQTVAVVGAGPSGCDILLQVAEKAKKVYILHSKASQTNDTFGKIPDNCVERQAVVDAESDALILADGSRIEDADHVIYCIGYKYSLPFFTNDDGAEPVVKVLHDGCVVSPLFADCVHTRYWDSLFFIGINFECLHFILFERHVQLALALIEHRLTKELIGAQLMDNFEADRIKKMISDNVPMKFFHRLAANQWSYYEWLGQLINMKTGSANKVEPISAVIRKIYDHVSQQRRKDLAGFKSISYKVTGPEEFTFIS